MRTLIISFSFFWLAGISIASESCHEDTKSTKQALPGDSLYNLSSEWMNQKGQTVNIASLQGQYRFIVMAYTKCQTACPLMVKTIQQVRSNLPKNKNKQLRVDVFSFESEAENKESLAGFVQKYKLDDTWSVYKADAGSVAELAAALGVQYKRMSSGEYIHSNLLFVLNDKGQIIAKHEGLSKPGKDFLAQVSKAIP